MIKDENEARCNWPLGRVDQANPDSNGLVRKVTVAIGDQSVNDNGKRNKPLTLLEWPIHKLVLLCDHC